MIRFGLSRLKSTKNLRIGMPGRIIQSRSLDNIAMGRLNMPHNRISGMPEGGMGMFMRHGITDFGSPWRGLIKVGAGFFERILGAEAKSIRAGSTPIKSLIEKLHYASTGAYGKEALSVLEQVRAAQQSGLKNVALIGDDLSGKQLRSIIRHERAHQFTDISTAKLRGDIHRAIQGLFPERIMEEFGKFGYKSTEVLDELIAINAEAEYVFNKTGKIDITDFKRFSKTPAIFHAIKKIHEMGLRSPKVNREVMRKARGMHFNLNAALEKSTNMVKQDVSQFTSPLAARRGEVRGSRRMPNGRS